MSYRGAHHNGHRPLPGDPLAALELRIEEAWLRLTARRGARPVTVCLTDAGNLTGVTPYEPRESGTEVGTYTHTVTLAQFREDVFFAHDQRRT